MLSNLRAMAGVAPGVAADGRPGLTFCDLSSFYTPTGGGIRTYHEAKLAWFAGQAVHRYLLVHPGASFSLRRYGPGVAAVSVFGARVGAGYRLPVDLRRISALFDLWRPDVLETGDPWISGPLGLYFRAIGRTRVVSSFYHSDPVDTYVAPWVHAHAMATRAGARLVATADRLFFRFQRAYDVTVASSGWVADKLARRGITPILKAPFGVDPAFLSVGAARQPLCPPRTRLLFVGRLQSDKAIDLVFSTLPGLLAVPGTTLTVVGAGRDAETLRARAPEQVRFLGYVEDRAALARVFEAHDVLLAPGPHETFGLGVLEGLASGLSVVAPDAGGAGEILRRLERPWLFRRDDAEDFVRAVRGAATTDGRQDAAAGVALASQYGTWAQAIGREVEAYCAFWSRSTT